MSEIELKLQVPPERRREVDAAVAGATPAKRVRLRAAYFETAERDLARAGLALRLRREGRRWVQTLKGAADDGLTRSEHNVVLLPIDTAGLAADAVPAIDAARHAGTPAGDRLAALLAPLPADALRCLYRTDILRRTRTMRTPGGTVELAYDEGAIVAGDARWPVCELEIELVSGAPQAVIDTARRWATRHRLWIDTRSKAERGDLAARGLAMAPPAKGQAVALDRRMALVDGRRLLFEACLRQVAGNASQVASGISSDEHVHQLRVGLRRLRTLLRLFDDAGLPPAARPPTGAPAVADPLAEGVADWFRRLGAARDAAAVLLPLAGQLDLARAQMRDAPPVAPPGAAPGAWVFDGAEADDDDVEDIDDLGGEVDGVGAVDGAEASIRAGHAIDDPDDPVAICRSRAAQAVLFALYGQVQMLRTAAAAARPPADAIPVPPRPASPLPPPEPALRDWFGERLKRWHRQVLRDLARFDTLDAEALHTLRKRAKRLRYAAEFAASLYKRGPVRRHLRPLAELQDRLGTLNDLSVAIQRFRDEADAGAASPEGDGRTWFALGWLVSQREAARAACRPAVKAYRKAHGFW